MGSKTQTTDFQQSIEQEVNASFHSSMGKLELFWKEFGITEDQVAERSRTVLGHVKTLLEDLVKEEEDLLISIKKQIKSYEVELEQLCLELNVKTMSTDEKLPLLQKEKVLHTQLAELTQKKQARIEKYQQMRKTETRLCTMLGMPKTSSISSTVPNEQELYELEQHVKMLSDEKERRYHKYCSAKKQLSTILEETDFAPETSFERDVICYDDNETFILSQENLDQLKQVVEKFQLFRQETADEIKQLSEKLDALWDRLKVDMKIRKEFTRKHSEIKRSTILAMQEEIERCEEVKMQNIKHYISTLREELVDLWEKCFICENKRHQFEPFYSEEYTEEVLQLHDTEVDKLKKYYEGTKDIFKKISKRDELWQMMLVFERKACDPKRFTNRGGNLLQEEKQRNKLLKDLPRLEDEILQDIGEYEEKTDTLFLINGIIFSDFIKMKWKEHQKEKENEKLERQKQRSIMMDSGSVRTPCKRPLFCTPVSAPSKLFCTRSRLSASSSKIAKQALTPRQPSIYSASQSGKKNATSRRHSPRFLTPKPARQGVLIEKNDANAKLVSHASNNTTSYADFERELDKDCRERCRSSVVVSKRKVRGSKINHSGSMKRRRSRTSFNASRSHSISKSLFRDNKSVRSTSRTPTKLTPARGKLGLPFLI